MENHPLVIKKITLYNNINMIVVWDNKKPENIQFKQKKH